MRRQDHEYFLTLVHNGGFKGGIISGPRGKFGVIDRVEIRNHLVVVYWQQDAEQRLPLPICVALDCIHRCQEDGEDTFHAKIFGREDNLWVLCPNESDEPEANVASA